MSIVARLFTHPGDAVAAVLHNREVTYGEFRADVERVAAYLRAKGLGPGSTIAIHFGTHRSCDDYSAWVAHLAAMRIGAAHASIHDKRHLSQLLDLVVPDAIVGRLPDGFESDQQLNVLELDVASLAEGDPGEDEADRAPRLNLTSGTTGRPKLIRWDSAMIDARVAQLSDLGVISSDTCLDCYLSPRTTAGFRYPLATWLAGGRVLLASSDGIEPLDRPSHSTLTALSPFQLQRLGAANLRWPGREGRTIVTLGGRLPTRVRDWALANLASKVMISYGSTEAGNVAHGDASVIDRHPGAVGWIRKDAQVEIVGPDGAEVERGKSGKLRLRTDVLAPDADGSDREWFEPGDFGVVYEDGLLAIGGRTADVLNVGGLKISSADLETKLIAIETVQDATALIMPTNRGDILWIVAVPLPGVAADDLLEKIKPCVVRGVPFRVVTVNAIPRNAMGKVDRRQLTERIRKHIRMSQQRKRVHA